MTKTETAGATLTRPTAEHERLGVFAGRWNLQGQSFESPFGPAAPITATETYEWLQGGLFLVHRFYGRLGGDEMACVEVIGHEGPGERYVVHSFYNNGQHNDWRLSARGETWTTEGAWPGREGTLQVRCTTVFDPSGQAARGRWEYAPDGQRWQTFWETELSRA